MIEIITAITMFAACIVIVVYSVIRLGKYSDGQGHWVIPASSDDGHLVWVIISGSLIAAGCIIWIYDIMIRVQ